MMSISELPSAVISKKALWQSIICTKIQISKEKHAQHVTTMVHGIFLSAITAKKYSVIIAVPRQSKQIRKQTTYWLSAQVAVQSRFSMIGSLESSEVIHEQNTRLYALPHLVRKCISLSRQNKAATAIENPRSSFQKTNAQKHFH